MSIPLLAFESFSENRCMDRYKSTQNFEEDEEESIHKDTGHQHAKGW